MSPTIRRTSRFRTSPFIYEWAKYSVGCRNQIGQQLVQLAPNWQAFGLREIRMNKLVRLLAVPALLIKSRPIKLLGASAVLVAITALLVSFKTARVSAASESEPGQDESKVEIGLEIAPVPLNFEGKDRGLVGLGSYIVNA